MKKVVFVVLVVFLLIRPLTAMAINFYSKIDKTHIEEDLNGHILNGWIFQNTEFKKIEILDAKYDNNEAVIYIDIDAINIVKEKGVAGKLRLSYEYAAKDWNLIEIKAIKFSSLKNYQVIMIKKEILTSNRFAALLYVANSIDYKPSKAYALAVIASEFAKAGKTEKADKLFSEARELAHSIKNEDGKADTLAIIAFEVEKADKTEKMLKMPTTAMEILNACKRALLEKILSNKIETLLKMATSIEVSEYCKGIALLEKSYELAKAGKIEKAIEIVNSMEAQRFKVRGLTIIASEFAKAGKTEKADKLFSDVLENANSIDNGQDFITFAIIASELAKAGKIEKADKLFSDVLAFTGPFFSANKGIFIILSVSLFTWDRDINKEYDSKIATLIMTAFEQK